MQSFSDVSLRAKLKLFPVAAHRYWEGEETWLGVVRQHLGQEVGNCKG